MLLIKLPSITLVERFNRGLAPGYYSVISISDGDTIVVNMDGQAEPVRLIGVNTPETHKPNTPVQCWGPQATDFTSQKIKAAGSQVRLEADPINTNRDRFDRLLRYAYLPDGTLLNSVLIEQGQGFAYTAFPFQKAEAFRLLGDLAKNQNLGLWANCQVITNQYDDFETMPI